MRGGKQAPCREDPTPPERIGKACEIRVLMLKGHLKKWEDFGGQG